MPTLITHNYFAKDVLDKFNKSSRVKLNINMNIYGVFAQSFDNFFYYRIPLVIGKKIRSFGYYCQHNNTQSYFINMIRLIKEKELEDNCDALAYLYGSITHYVLDSVVHPFVFYKTGTFKSRNKNHHKYSGLHAKMEYMLDAYMYNKSNDGKFYKYKFYKDILPKVKITKELKKLVDETYFKTFNKKNMAKYYFKGYNWSRLCYKIFAYDSTGLKKIIYNIIDKLTTTKIKNVKYYSLNIKKIDANYLNNEKEEWNHPSDKNLKFNFSFDDLYDMALNRAVDIFSNVKGVLEDKKDIRELINVIPNIDYTTGFLIQKNKPMKYFEF